MLIKKKDLDLDLLVGCFSVKLQFHWSPLIITDVSEHKIINYIESVVAKYKIDFFLMEKSYNNNYDNSMIIYFV